MRSALEPETGAKGRGEQGSTAPATGTNLQNEEVSENQGPGTLAPNSPRHRLGVREAPQPSNHLHLCPPVPELPGQARRGAQGDTKSGGVCRAS